MRVGNSDAGPRTLHAGMSADTIADSVHDASAGHSPAVHRYNRVKLWPQFDKRAGCSRGLALIHSALDARSVEDQTPARPLLCMAVGQRQDVVAPHVLHHCLLHLPGQRRMSMQACQACHGGRLHLAGQQHVRVPASRAGHQIGPPHGLVSTPLAHEGGSHGPLVHGVWGMP